MCRVCGMIFFFCFVASQTVTWRHMASMLPCWYQLTNDISGLAIGKPPVWGHSHNYPISPYVTHTYVYMFIYFILIWNKTEIMVFKPAPGVIANFCIELWLVGLFGLPKPCSERDTGIPYGSVPLLLSFDDGSRRTICRPWSGWMASKADGWDMVVLLVL